MEFTYKKDPGHNYAIPSFSVPDSENYILQMLCDNQIPGLLHVSLERMNGRQIVRYEITSLQPMTALFVRQGMNGTDVTRVLEGFLTAYESAAAYLLNPEDILTDPAYIYMDPESRKTFVCYLPGWDAAREIGTSSENSSASSDSIKGNVYAGKPYVQLAEFILRHLKHEDPMAVELAYGFYELASREHISFLQSVKQLLPGVHSEQNDVERGSAEEQYEDRQNGSNRSIYVKNQENQFQKEKTAKNQIDQNRTAQKRNDQKRNDQKRNDQKRTDQKRTDQLQDTFLEYDYDLDEKRFLEADDENERRGIGRHIGKSHNSTSYNSKRKTQNKEKGSADRGRRHRKSHPDKKQGRQSDAGRKRLWIWILIIGLLGALYAGLVMLLHLDLTQMGGLFFLFAAVIWLVYGTISGRREKNRNHWSEVLGSEDDEEDEEAFIRQLMSEVYDMSGEESAENREPAERLPGQSPDFLQEHRSASERVSLDAEDEASYGSTRILYAGADTPHVTLLSSNIRYPNLQSVGAENLIGKQTDRVDMALPKHDAVSRIHAKLECSKEGIFLADMNSTNGTWVNGQQIAERAELHNGDQVSFAGLIYRVRIEQN